MFVQKKNISFRNIQSLRDSIRLILALVLLLGLFGSLPAIPAATQTASIRFVMPEPNGAGNCTDWENACDLEYALNIADADDQIWVAEGEHIPTSGSGDARQATFELADGVKLYGGFDGTETTLAQRDLTQHITVLSGDVDENDLNKENHVVGDSSDIQGNNAYHVVTGNGLGSTTVLDGFVITAGAADADIANAPNNLGGGMYNNASSPALINVTFSGNRANDGGGGVFNDNGSSPALMNVGFVGNSANASGGGMSSINTTDHLELTDVTFSNNSAYLGGAMYSANITSTLVLSNVLFSNNSADFGGAMYNANITSTLTLTTVTFSENLAEDSGGGMYNANTAGALRLMGVIFSENSANSEGGGMYNADSSPILTTVNFHDNSGGGDGGGMYNDNNSSPLLTDVTFMNNSAQNGGGIYNNSSNPIVTNTTISGNSALLYGGGISNYQSSPSLTNVTLTGNTADEDGGGMFNQNSNPTLTNVTLSANNALNSGGGIANYVDSNPTLTNAILWGNRAATSNQIYNDASSTSLVSYSDIEDASSSTENNIDANPLFERNPAPGPDGQWATEDDDYGDLHPQLGSPAIDSGTNNGCPATDLDGDLRALNGICDMGAYETGYALQITTDNMTPEPGQTINFTLVVTNYASLATGGVISNVLPAGLNFLGPLTLDPAGNGSVGSPPTLASDLTIAPTTRVTVTFPVTVSYGLTSGTQLINTAAFSTSEVITPTQASITITVQNAAPLALDDGGIGFSTSSNTAFSTANVLANDSDPNGDPLSVSDLNTHDTLGLVTNNGDGTFTYDPNGQFQVVQQASDVFTYTVTDGQGSTDTAMVTITINGSQGSSRIYLPLVMH